MPSPQGNPDACPGGLVVGWSGSQLQVGGTESNNRANLAQFTLELNFPGLVKMKEVVSTVFEILRPDRHNLLRNRSFKYVFSID